MAKRNGGEPLRAEEKRALNKQNLSRLLGVFRFILPYKWFSVVGFIALALSTSTLLAFPYLAGELLNIASNKPSPYFKTITDVAIVLLGTLVLQGIFSFIRVYTFAIVSERSLADIRKALYQKIVWLPMTFFDNFFARRHRKRQIF